MKTYPMDMDRNAILEAFENDPHAIPTRGGVGVLKAGDVISAGFGEGDYAFKAIVAEDGDGDLFVELTEVGTSAMCIGDPVWIRTHPGNPTVYLSRIIVHSPVPEPIVVIGNDDPSILIGNVTLSLDKARDFAAKIVHAVEVAEMPEDGVYRVTYVGNEPSAYAAIRDGHLLSTLGNVVTARTYEVHERIGDIP